MQRLLAVLVLLSWALTAHGDPPRGALRGWNVILVTLDTVDPRRIGTWGGGPATMPFLDALAKASLVFERAYCTTGSTGPSHATILSAQLPARHGVHYNGLPVAKETFWLPEALRGAGYLTVGSSIAPFMSARERFDRGFDRFVATQDNRGEASNAFGYDQFLAFLGESGWKRLPQPFFAWIHLKGGHDPLVPIDPEFLARHSRTLSPDALPAGMTTGHSGLTAAQQQVTDKWYAYYDANLSEADATVEVLYRHLERTKLLDRTLLIVMADHGESFDHGIIGEHWPSPWESTLRIPLLIHARGAVPPGRDRALVSTADVAPTILYLLGVSADERQWEGEAVFDGSPRSSIVAASPYAIAYESLLARARTASPADFRQQAGHLRDTGLFYWVFLDQSVRGPLYKLIYFDRGGAYRLYDVTSDPREERDLLRDGKTARRQVRSMLVRARAADPYFAAGPGIGARGQTVAGGQPTMGLPRETIEILRSLGYLQ